MAAVKFTRTVRMPNEAALRSALLVLSCIWKSRLWKLYLAASLQIVRCRVVVVLEVGGKRATRSACIAPATGEPLNEQPRCNPVRVRRNVLGLVT